MGMTMPLHSANTNILNVTGRSNIVLYTQILKKGVAIVILYFTYSYGVVPVLLGQIAAAVFTLLPHLFITSRIIQYGAVKQIGAIMPTLLLAVTLAAGARALVWMSGWESAAGLTSFIALALLGYVIGGWSLKLYSHRMVADVFRNFIYRHSRRATTGPGFEVN